mgnify:CR=1 FL=1
MMRGESGFDLGEYADSIRFRPSPRNCRERKASGANGAMWITKSEIP